MCQKGTGVQLGQICQLIYFAILFKCSDYLAWKFYEDWILEVALLTRI